MMTMNLNERERHPLELVGSFCEVVWAPSTVLPRPQCQKCVYLVRGLVGSMVCIELVYDAIQGKHGHDQIYWVPVNTVVAIHVLSEAAAQQRIERLEREALQERPRD